MSSVGVQIEAYCHRTFLEQQPIPVVVPWIGAYYEGLLAPFELDADATLLDGGKNNDFLAMARHVMTDLQSKGSLDDISLFLMAHQTLDTYFPFRSTTTRLCREFQIDAPAIGMTEQELTSPYIGLIALLAAFRQQSFSGSGLLLVLDQATLPYARPNAPADCIDNAFVMKLSASSDGNGIRVDGKKYWAPEGSKRATWVVQSIYAYLDEKRIEMNDVHVVLEEKLAPEVSASLPASVSVTDARLMSPAGLVAALDHIARGSISVLLVHLATDGHLYLFSFGEQGGAATRRDTSCSI